MTTDEGTSNNGENPTATVLEQGEDITTKKDRGVLKIVKRVGSSDEAPMIGDRVYVHYKGKLSNGKKFDSSHDRNEPFVFSLGKGQVIKAWDIGVSSMKKGEVCHLVCKPEYAYGSAGSLPKIPPNATLFFEIELLDFKGEDLFEDSGIIRRIKRKGEGYSNPNEGATVEASAVRLTRTGQSIKAFCAELMSSKGSREKDALPEETKSLNGHSEKAHSEEKKST